MKEQYCNQCENQCPADALRCNRGRAYFGMEPAEVKMPEGPIGLLKRCGHLLHHGGVEMEGALSALTDREQEDLERLLTVLLDDWQKRQPKGEHRHGHHGHH